MPYPAATRAIGFRHRPPPINVRLVGHLRLRHHPHCPQVFGGGWFGNLRCELVLLLLYDIVFTISTVFLSDMNPDEIYCCHDIVWQLCWTL